MSLSLIDTCKIFINTIVRIMPIALYTGSAMSGAVFQDFRGLLLFCGFLGNELLGLGYRMVLRGASNPQCALTYSEGGTPFVLPSPISQTVGFFAGWGFGLQQLYKDEIDAGILQRSTVLATTVITVLLLLLAIVYRIYAGQCSIKFS